MPWGVLCGVATWSVESVASKGLLSDSDPRRRRDAPLHEWPLKPDTHLQIDFHRCLVWVRFVLVHWRRVHRIRAGPPVRPLRGRLDADILKITRHGSGHGTGQTFVDAVDLWIAAASTSQDPDHRLEPEVRTHLGQGVKIFDTFTEGGDFIIRTDGQRWVSGGQTGVVYEVRIEQLGWFMGQQW